MREIAAGFGSKTDIGTAAETEASFMSTRPGAVAIFIDSGVRRRSPAGTARVWLTIKYVRTEFVMISMC